MQKALNNPTKASLQERRFTVSREMAVLGVLILLCIFMTILSPYFLTSQNLFNVLRSISTIGIMAIGMTMIIASGGIDLSIGSVLAAGAMFTARLMTYDGVNPWVAVLGGLGVGLILGGINGLIITRVKVSPFITTLGMMSIARGIAYLLATGLQGAVASNIPMRDPSVNFLGGGYIGPVPFALIEMVVLVVIASVVMHSTVFGRQIYAIGSNEQAARLSGVNVNLVRLMVYTITGVLAAYAGIMNAGLLSTAATNLGLGNEMDVIAAVIIGGASLSGGEGTIYGAVIGAAIMAILRNAFVLLHFPIHWQTVTIGVVVILAVASDRLRKRS
ncbi:MAG TPA: ABC transporter permease [Anaerolineaceae bacterium]|nr:ABC transporter permease [Anaerolineaceae bacterium]